MQTVPPESYAHAEPTAPGSSPSQPFQLFAAVAAGITVRDERGELLYANAEAAGLCGFPSAEAMLASEAGELPAPSELFDQEGRRLPWSELPGRRLARGLPAPEIFLRFVLSDQTERWSWVSARPLALSDGRRAFVSTFRDATHMIEAQRGQREQEQRLLIALEAGTMGVWEWRIAESKVHWSPALERMHGIPVGSFDGSFEAYQRDIHPDDKERVLGTIQRTVAEKCDHNLLYRIIRPDGAVCWLEAFGRLLLDAEGKPSRLLGVCRDVTERVHAEEARALFSAEQAARQEAERGRERTRRILEGITDSFAVYDPAWRVVFANEENTRPIGLKPADVIGKVAWEIIPAAIGTPIYEQLMRAMETQTRATILEYFAPLDRWFEAHAYPLGELGLAVYSRDVTEVKRAEQLRARLRRDSELRTEIAMALAEPRDLHAMLGDCAKALCQRGGFSRAQIWLANEAEACLERVAEAGVHERDGTTRVGLGERALGLSPDTRGVQRLTARDGDSWETAVAALGWSVESVALAPLRVGERIVGVVAAAAEDALSDNAFDALGAIAETLAQGSERRRAELELDQRAHELARSNADLEQFAYVASHDLQEPLRMVASYTQLLARRYQGRLDQNADEFIAFAVEGVTRMQRLINDLLAYSRIGRLTQNIVEVPASHALEAALSNLSTLIAETEAQITHDALPALRADPSQLMQLFQNLVGNALKFRREGEPAKVHVGVQREGGEWVFSVRDNGIGIEPKHFERIFVIFQRLNARENYPGTGIGLAVAKRIIERHGGRIWIESTPGVGTTMFFSLPARNARTTSERP